MRKKLKFTLLKNFEVVCRVVQIFAIFSDLLVGFNLNYFNFKKKYLGHSQSSPSAICNDAHELFLI